MRQESASVTAGVTLLGERKAWICRRVHVVVVVTVAATAAVAAAAAAAAAEAIVSVSC